MAKITQGTRATNVKLKRDESAIIFTSKGVHYLSSARVQELMRRMLEATENLGDPEELVGSFLEDYTVEEFLAAQATLETQMNTHELDPNCQFNVVEGVHYDDDKR
jgi:hypothetical protein